MGFPERGGALLVRDANTDEFLKLIADPFSVTLTGQALWAAVGTSIGFTVLIAIAFSFLRPYNSVVYAPKLKHADDKHAPPPVGRGVFAWIAPVLRTTEKDIILQVGLDATVFLRFLRMCRNIFIVIAIFGCGIIIPINLTLSVHFDTPPSWVLLVTPLFTFGEPTWGLVVCAWLFDIVIAGYLWWNYRAVLKLRKQYFDSPEYQKSLHARTLMINNLPMAFRSDEGIGRVIDEVVPTSSFSRCAVARNVKELPEMIEQHNKAVRQLEKYLAKYLPNPDQLPSSRPLCKPSKDDPSYGSYLKSQKVDAIEYLTGRIRELEIEIKEVRLTVDKRNAMPYGFASYEDISEAHSIAFAARNKHPQGTTIVLAPRPNDVIWKNMALSKSSIRWRKIVNTLWVALLTLFWIAPNAMISIFLVHLVNLGLVWPGFKASLAVHTTWWAIVQGVASPAITSFVFLILPIIFRRLAIHSGDRTKTARERHVTSQLYFFFIFNNLVVFNLFSVVWSFVSSVIGYTGQGQSAWDAINKADLPDLLFTSLCNVSPFWVTYLLQRNLGAAVDLAQLWTLFWSFCVRKFSSPTPREMIELTAPQAFDYASYYNYFLFYATVTLCFATIQPLVLPAAAAYFALDVYLKKYLLLYIFITKTESGGMFWRLAFNRMVFATIISNVVVFFVAWVHGDNQHVQAYSVLPLLFLMVGFKIYCRMAFDDKIQYYSVRNMPHNPEEGLNAKPGSKGDKLASRFGHPALYKPLITPMVHARAQNILASIYGGRLSDGKAVDGSDMASVSGYSDTFALDPMRAGQPGRAAPKNQILPGFEMVPESQLDFSYYKSRPEFGDEHGGGQIYSQETDVIDRPGTSNTFRGGYGSPGSSRSGSPVPGSYGNRRMMTGMTGLSAEAEGDIGKSRFYQHRNDSDAALPLVGGAAEMPVEAPMPARKPVKGPPEGRAPGFLGGGPQGYGGLPQQEEEAHTYDDDTSYDRFRVRSQRSGWQGWTG